MKVDLQFPIIRYTLLRSEQIADQIFHYFIFFKLLSKKIWFNVILHMKEVFSALFSVDMVG